MKNASLDSIQLLLLRCPLYRFVRPDGRIDVRVLGWNETASLFVDTVLALGQHPEHRLTVTVYADRTDEILLNYLDWRPALPEFVHVLSGSEMLFESKRHYADLRFLPPEDFCRSRDCVSGDEEKAALPPYVLIVSDSPEENRAALERCRAAASGSAAENPSLIALWEEGRMLIDRQGQLISLEALSAPLEQGRLSLREMAFNAHLIWKSQINLDIQAEWERFNAPENEYLLFSSLSFVLSIPYKLWAAGISPEDPDSAAEAFSALLADGRDHRLLHRLMDLEQRRWVLEKIAAGYVSSYRRGDSSVFEDFLRNGSVRSDRAHLCIQHSEPSAPLEGEWYQKKNHYYWDVPNREDEKLDDLDRMSVDLHRFMMQKARELRDARFAEQNESIRALDAAVLVKEKPAPAGRKGTGFPGRVHPLRVEYNRFLFCVRSVLDGSGTYARQYDAYEADLQRAFRRYAQEKLPEARELLGRIRLALFPAIEAHQYRNYKQNNLDLVRYIPFIMTYRRLQRMALPFSAAEQRTNINDRIFGNVASAMVLKPGVLLYLYQVQAPVSPQTFEEMLRACAAYLRNNRVPCELSLAVSFSPEITEARKSLWMEHLTALREDRCILALFTECTASSESFFLDLMKKQQISLYDGSAPLYGSGLRQAEWIQRVRSAFGYFEMDSASGQFLTSESCRWLSHIRDTSILRIDDMFTLLGCENREHDYTDCMEYFYPDEKSTEPEPLFRCLWKIYTGQAIGQTWEKAVFGWNQMCDALEAFNNSRQAGIGRLDAGAVDFGKLAELSRGAVGAGFRKLQDVGIAEKILSAIGELRNARGEHALIVEYNSAGHISTIRAARDSLVKLLTQAGAILEVYCFYQALETGCFDDAACSCTFYWGDREYSDSERKNEIDLILTKGFRSVFAECKATADLTQAYYHKLNSLADLFGINAKKVIIANTYSTGRERAERNLQQISRGGLMDILTISGEEDLSRIGNRLMEVMKKSV